MSEVTFDQPVKAKLVIELENGVKLEATPENVKKFGYINASETYSTFVNHVSTVLHNAGVLSNDQDITDNPITSLRYVFELACFYPELLKSPEMADENARIAELARLAKQKMNDEY